MFNFNVSNSNMWREVHEQPEIIAGVLQKNESVIVPLCDTVRKRKIKNVVLAGRGSSEHALIFAKYAFEVFTSMTATMCSPSVITQYNGNVDLSDSLVIGVSQCGQAKDVCAVLNRCRAEGGIAVSITNEIDCLMRNAGDFYINCECGKETSFTAAKSYLSQVVILLMIVANLSGDEKLQADIQTFPQLIAECLNSQFENQVKESIPLFRNARDVLILGRGFSYAVANETELKIMEASYTNAKAYSSCDYPHGPIATTQRYIPVICFLTDERTDESTVTLVEKLKHNFDVSVLVVTNKQKYEYLGNAVVRVPETADGVTGAIADVLFSQLFACLLAIARGYNPDEPIGLSKTTVTF